MCSIPNDFCTIFWFVSLCLFSSPGRAGGALGEFATDHATRITFIVPSHVTRVVD